jgi:hypothetical protein
MKAVLALLVVLTLTSACSGYLLPASPTDNPAVPESGIMGRVTIGPACPVVRVESPCPDRPYQTTLTVTDPLGEQVIAKIETDASGKFRLALPPGDYRLVPTTPSPAAPPQAQPMPFHLDARQWLELDVVYDSGIR